MSEIRYEGYITPCRIFSNIYFVGTRPASTHIIETGEGLILVDPGYSRDLDKVLENIKTVGLDIKDIKIILLTHGHGDHAGAVAELVELTGASVYIGAGDLPMVSGRVDSGYSIANTFMPDRLLNDGDRFSLGETEIYCISTPGHTDGTISFFFDVTDGENTYRAGMFGGAGTNTLTGKYLCTHRMPLSNREKFLSSIERLRGERVEIFLGNHVGNNDTEGKIAKVMAGDKYAFLDPDGWFEFLTERENRLLTVIKEEEEEMKNTVEKILEEKLIMIVRGVDPEKTVELAEAMYRGGVRLMECTYDATGKTPDETVAKTIETLAKRFEGRMLIGAGTVLTKKQVQLTSAAGGRFIISPDTNPEIIEETKKAGMVSIPGGLTPSEATLANRSGADFVKLFPISQNGAGYVKALRAPLSHIRFLAVGGVTADNATDYMKNGACGVGMGLGADDRNAIESGDWDYIENKYRELVKKLK